MIWLDGACVSCVCGGGEVVQKRKGAVERAWLYNLKKLLSLTGQGAKRSVIENILKGDNMTF